MSQALPTRFTAMKAISDACKADDVAAMTEAIDLANQPGCKLTAEEALTLGLTKSVAANATQVLVHVLEQGADPVKYGANVTLCWGIFDLPSRETLNILVAHGWDINSRPRLRDWPVLWHVTGNYDLVEWCLAHGASVNPPDNSTAGVAERRRPILERAAAIGDIPTFELLLAHGAPLSERLLPVAVRAANDYTPGDHGMRNARNAEQETRYQKHVGMVRYLIDVMKMNVNELAVWPGIICSTPLCCIACHPKGDAKDLIHVLLDRGGDPHRAGPSSDFLLISSALKSAKRWQNEAFLHVVEEWRSDPTKG